MNWTGRLVGMPVCVSQITTPPAAMRIGLDMVAVASSTGACVLSSTAPIMICWEVPVGGDSGSDQQSNVGTSGGRGLPHS